MEQLKTVQDYCSITLQPNCETARVQLEKFSWNLENAVNDFFDSKIRPPFESYTCRLFDENIPNIPAEKATLQELKFSILEHEMQKTNQIFDALLSSSRKKWKKRSKEESSLINPPQAKVTDSVRPQDSGADLKKETPDVCSEPSKVSFYVEPDISSEKEITRVQLCSHDKSQKVVKRVYLDTTLETLDQIACDIWKHRLPASVNWGVCDSSSGKITVLNLSLHRSMTVAHLHLKNAQIFEILKDEPVTLSDRL